MKVHVYKVSELYVIDVDNFSGDDDSINKHTIDYALKLVAEGRVEEEDYIDANYVAIIPGGQEIRL